MTHVRACALQDQPPDPQPRAPRIAARACSPYTSDHALPDDYLRVQADLGLRRAVALRTQILTVNPRELYE